MGTPRHPPRELLIVAAFSRHADALAWAQARLAEMFGPIALESEPYPFDQTRYYEPAMGPGLRKQLHAFRELIPPGTLAEIKLRTNALEAELAAAGRYPEPRPLNLDPGLLSLGKFILATTKDQAHRVYLRDGIFAEVTLRFHAGAFVPWPWTYADYRLPAVLDFLRRARAYYREQLGHQPPDA
jgi:hypothetical protein